MVVDRTGKFSVRFKVDAINARIICLPVTASSHACPPAMVGWKRPFQHLNPTSVEICRFGCQVHTISEVSHVRRPEVSRRGQERTAVELHMTVTGAPLSVFVRISFTTTFFAVGMNE